MLIGYFWFNIRGCGSINNFKVFHTHIIFSITFVL